MLDREHPTYIALAGDVRKRFRSVTAFRFGVLAGERRLPAECPYDDARSRRLFAEGVAFGSRWIERVES